MTQKTKKTKALNKSASLLDFSALCQLLQQLCFSAMAREWFDQVTFLADIDQINTSLDQIKELCEILVHDEPLPFHDLHDIRTELDAADIEGAFINEEALLNIALMVKTAAQLKKYFHNRQEQYHQLWQIARRIVPLFELSKDILAKIDQDSATVKDNASVQLNRVRKSIFKAEADVRKATEKLFKKYNDKGYLQDALITLSDGKLVFPVKGQHKNQINGLVHSESASGATLYIEPIEALELNNKVRTLRIEEAREVERILRALTAIVRENLEPVVLNLTVLVEFDILQAKAKFAQKFNCAKPALNTNNEIYICNGRHPLLQMHKGNPGEVVPLNMKLNHDLHTLIITGPNAGGKSVAMKTVGLFCLMVKAGLLVPAQADSNIPVVNDIFTDIGDFQSIENDLSTFSSHIKNMQNILENADHKSLVLVDEIGVGTDPDEGASLAISFLEELTLRGCLTIVTTHLGTLKAFAYDTPGVENGSMEFNMETLEPTYRFRLGIPGSSYALEISKRLGLPESLLTRARQLVGHDKERLEQLIMDLERRLQESEDIKTRLQIDKNRVDGLNKLYQERYNTLKSSEDALRQKALEEADKIIAESNALVEHIIKEIRETEAERNVIQKAKLELKQKRQEIQKRKRKTVTVPEVKSEPALLEIRIGIEALWQKQRARGRISAIADDGEKVLLEIGTMKFWVPVHELSPAGDQQKKPVQVLATTEVSKNEVLPEIDLRGERLDEAISRVDKFLDDALLAGWEEVRLIHGKGTGALRKGISAFLDKHIRVRKHRIGAWNQGDLGVTIVELK